MPYTPGTILRSDVGSYVYRVTNESVREGRSIYDLVVVGANGGCACDVGHRLQRSRDSLDRYGYRPEMTITINNPPGEEVNMKIHTLIHNSPEVATPISAVTMPEAMHDGSVVATRRFTGRSWNTEDEPTFGLSGTDNVLIEFSDGSLGVCGENHLATALATFDLQLTES